MALVQILVILTWSLGTAVAQEPSNSLTDIEVQALPGNEIQLRLVLSGPAPKPLTFTIDQPARIALDLADTGLALGSRRKDVNIGALDTILVAEAGGRTRVVLNLDNIVPYRTRVEGNSVYVTLSAGSGAAVTQFAAAGSGSAEGATDESASQAGSQFAAARGGRSVKNIDFRRTESGGGRVIVQMSDAGIPVDVRQEGGSIVVNFIGTSLPDSLMKRLDVLYFGTPVRTIDALRVGKDTRLVISALGPFEELAYQSNDVFSVEVYELVQERDERPATLFSQKREYTGERLTLNFQDIDSRAVLQLLADISGRNIVVSDTVQGNVTLRLQNVPWDQALDIVLATKGLDMRQNGNVIIVAPAEEIAAREKADLESRQAIRQLEPLMSEYVQVNYAKAGDLADLISGAGENSLLSDRGTVGIDERTNTLLVQDTADNIGNIRRLVTTLDIPVRQVLIESRIVIVTDDYRRDLGIQWGATIVSDKSDGLIAVSGNSTGTDDIVNSALDQQAATGSLIPVDIPNLQDRFMVSLPVASPGRQLGTGGPR